jgi:hypothetical protein
MGKTESAWYDGILGTLAVSGPNATALDADGHDDVYSETKVPREPVSQCTFVHHKSNMTWPELNWGPCSGKLGTNHVSCGTALGESSWSNNIYWACQEIPHCFGYPEGMSQKPVLWPTFWLVQSSWCQCVHNISSEYNLLVLAVNTNSVGDT